MTLALGILVGLTGVSLTWAILFGIGSLWLSFTGGLQRGGFVLWMAAFPLLTAAFVAGNLGSMALGLYVAGVFP